MRNTYRAKRIFTLAFALIVAATVRVSAATFSDVPSWAAAAVDKVTSLGYMSGDLKGNFNPSDYIDKFETARILAKMAGYKATGATQAEQAEYDKYYDRHKSYISLYQNKFTKWNSTVNKEIAFLLEKNILIDSDLNQFVIIVEGQEKLKSLSKEDAAIFLVKYMGKTQAALASPKGTAFADDAKISSDSKPYVYYLKTIGVISGDGQNKFNPTSSVTKVIMAVMINGVYNYMNPSAAPKPTTAPTAAPNPSATAAPASGYETVSGTIVKLYSSFRAIQITSSNVNYNNKIYIISSSAVIYINGAAKSYADLAEGMTFTGLISNSEITSLSVTSGSQNPSAVPAVPAATLPPSSALEYSNIEGTVTMVKTDGAANYISVEVRILNMKGDIYTEIRTFIVAANCAITKGSASALFSSVAKGDIVKAKVSGSYVYSLEIEQKNRTLAGEITGKHFKTTTSLPIITIIDTAKQSYDLLVNSDSKLYKSGIGNISWNDLRIGDKVQLTTEYDTILTLNATGEISYKEGYIKVIYISNSYSSVTVTDDNNADNTYLIVPGTVDPYTLRLGSRMSFRLDSKEIMGANLISDAQNSSVTGIVSYVTSSAIYFRDASLSSAATRTVTFNANTIFLDAASGNRVNYTALYSDMKIFVIFSDSASNLAKSVTILSK